MTNSNGEYRTSDTSLASYLITEGFSILEIDYSKPRYEFIFQNDFAHLQEHSSKYISGKALVDPATFTRVNRKLLRLVKNQLQWWGE